MIPTFSLLLTAWALATLSSSAPIPASNVQLAGRAALINNLARAAASSPIPSAPPAGAQPSSPTGAQPPLSSQAPAGPQPTGSVAQTTDITVETDQRNFASQAAGNAKVRADDIVNGPFKGVDLATVSPKTLSDLKAMDKAIGQTDKDFIAKLKTATGADAEALQVGRTQNKVLMYTVELQIAHIDKAQGRGLPDTHGSQDTRLDDVAAKDAANAGKASNSV